MKGFTLIEMTLVVALLASLIAAEAERRALAAKELRREHFVAQVRRIDRAVHQYRRDRAALGEDEVWPSSMADLLQAPHNNKNYLGRLAIAQSVFGGDFSLSGGADETDMILETDVGNAYDAELLASRLSSLGSEAQGSTVRFSLLADSSTSNSAGVTELEDYYLLSGTRSLAGTMDANRNSIVNLYEVQTQDLVVEGTQAVLSDPRNKREAHRLPTQGEALAGIEPLAYHKMIGPRQVAELGFAADQVAELYPQLVRERRDGNGQKRDYLSYNGLLAVLWAEVQYLSERVRVLEAEQPVDDH